MCMLDACRETGIQFLLVIVVLVVVVINAWYYV